MTHHSRQELRQKIRVKRRALSVQEQHDASKNLVAQCSSLNDLDQADHIAIYLSTDGELDTTPLIKWLWQKKKSVYIPVIHPFSQGQLLFLRYHPHSKMVLNRYNISEPKLRKDDIIPVNELDIIFTPLVAFDSQGHRLGMGGGYYDRTLEPWFKTAQGAKPIGLAHHCQHVETLPTESWDVPLPTIITPEKIWCW